MNIYELSARYQQLLDQDEYTPEDMTELESIHDNIEDSCIDYAKFIRNMEAQAEGISKAINEMKERENYLDLRIVKHKEKLIERMRSNNIEKITKSPLFAIKITLNPTKVDDYDCSLIPNEYRYFAEPKPVEKINKTAIREAIESGIDVPGARLVRNYKIDFK